jgi:DNA-binding CsgD family transcriptional regulator
MFARANDRYRLAPQQRRLLWLNLWGYSDEEIASTLGISRHTVQDYQLALRKKTGVRSKAGYLRLLMQVVGAEPPAEMAQLLEARAERTS